MAEADYEYYGLMAQTWDLFRGDTSTWEDRKFYLEIIREAGQPVLDVGCGTGRLLVDYLSQGVDIDGVDISQEMIELCQKKMDAQGLKTSLYIGDMETMQLPRQYQTILVPSSSFQLLVEPLCASRAIANLYTHLLPGGTLVMPFMRLRKDGDTLEHDWHLTGEGTRKSDGATVQRWSKDRFDLETKLEHNEDRYEIIKDGVVISSEHHMQSPATREYTQKQAMDLFIYAGFVDLRIFKDFTHEQASAEDEIFTICGQRP